ncbi:unnamed protein product [Symbiodinium natans]|uniref:Uncharacterized protein n=1 Tax=Symbiodinium natans TaxID=878477 RepID=A0A812P956_9DINO|nr:unnamed protein product [Symbiodinium natans]
MRHQALLTALPLFVLLRYNLCEDRLPKKVVQPTSVPSLPPQAMDAWRPESKAEDAQAECGFWGCLALPGCIPKGSIGALCDPSQGKPGNVSWLQNETLPTMPQT